MSTKTSIEWTDATWNPIRGCSRVSEGCRNCYAERVAYRFSGPGLPYEGLAHKVNGHAAWTGDIEFVEKHLLDPLTDPDMREPVIEHREGCLRVAALIDGKWRPKCGCPERPRRIFVNSMSDLFHENVSDEWLDQIFAAMALCPQHTFQILTKRPERMREYFTAGIAGGFHPQAWRACQAIDALYPERTESSNAARRRLIEGCPNVQPLPNVWLGVSVEDQKTADERIALLLQTPAAVRFISAEPLLGPVDLREFIGYGKYHGNIPGTCVNIDGETWHDKDQKCHTCGWGFPDDPDWPKRVPGLDWVICGGESGPGARPMHPDWARSLRDQCQAAGVAFFFKQWGEWAKYIDRDVEDPDWRQPYSRFKSAESFCFLNLEGGSGFHGERVHVMQRIGKHAAGAMLDGREWREFPEASR